MPTARSLPEGDLPDRDPLPPGQRPPPRTETPGQRPPCGQTDACENITLPQTSFAGGNDTESNYDVVAKGYIRNLHVYADFSCLSIKFLFLISYKMSLLFFSSF